MTLLDRQGNPVDPQIALQVWGDEMDIESCENGIWWNCEFCMCKDDPQRHV